MWDTRLIEAGVDLVPVDARHVRLRHRGAQVVARVVRTPRRLHPSAVTDPPEPASLLIAPVASPVAAERARAAGWSLVTDEGPGWIRFSDRNVLELEQTSEPPPQPAPRRGRPPWGTLAVVRSLLGAAPASQTRLAARAGVSQARVSQVLAPLRREHLVQRTADGWAPTDWDALCDWWLAHYPGPGGLTTWWASLDAPTVQATAAVASLDRSACPLVSGDVAADLIAPWRRPALAVIYARHGADLSPANLTPLPSGEGATLALVVPDDDSVWPAEPITRTRNGIELTAADGVQVLYDLHRSPGPDAAEAAARWRTHLADSLNTGRRR